MKKPNIPMIFIYIFLLVICFISVFPFYWIIVSTTNRSADVITGKLTFGSYLFENIKTMTSTLNVGRAFWNSLRTSVVNTVLNLFVCSLAGFGFQIYRDKHKDRLMGILLLSMMIPFASVMIPLFQMFSMAHLLNTTLGFVLPSISTAFMIFFFRQNSVTFPQEVIQAARVDGLSEVNIYFRIYVPIMSPTFAAAAIVTFMNSWNNYMWPLIAMQKQDMQTMPLLISGLSSNYTTDYGLLMLTIMITTLPTLVLFFTQQRRFVEGVTGSVK